MEVDGQHADKKLRTRSRSRSQSRPIEEVVRSEELRDSAQKKKAIKKSRNSVKNRNKEARRGEAGPSHPHLETEASLLSKTRKQKDKQTLSQSMRHWRTAACHHWIRNSRNHSYYRAGDHGRQQCPAGRTRYYYPYFFLVFTLS